MVFSSTSNIASRSSLPPLVKTKSATLQFCSVALSFKWESCAPMDSARREEIFGMGSWFDRLLSVHHIHSGRQMFPCSAHALALQRIDLLHTVCTESPAFHRGGFSGEIARFWISHRYIGLVFVVGHCALQLRAVGKHAFRFRAVPIRIAPDGSQRRATGEHPTHIEDVLGIEVRQVKRSQTRATIEHTIHGGDVLGVEVRQVQRSQTPAIEEHP